MGSFLLLFLHIFYVALIAGQDVPNPSNGRNFRTDYTYHEAVQGWTRLNRMPERFERARLRCSLERSTLATPMSNDVKKIMLDAMGQQSVNAIFLGMSAIYSDGDFYSVEGDLLENLTSVISWAPGEPNNPGDEQCIAMYANGTLADVNCNTPLPYICFRKEPETTPSLGQCGTIDPEYTFEAKTGHCYKVHRFGQIWSKAFMTCSAEGGYLAISNSDAEFKHLKSLMIKFLPHKIFAKHSYAFAVGFRDWSGHSKFMTIHGQTLQEAGFENWSGGEPNDLTGEENCGSIFRTALLNDARCDNTLAFICEMEPWSLQKRIKFEPKDDTDANSKQGNGTADANSKQGNGTADANSTSGTGTVNQGPVRIYEVTR